MIVTLSVVLPPPLLLSTRNSGLSPVTGGLPITALSLGPKVFSVSARVALFFMDARVFWESMSHVVSTSFLIAAARNAFVTPSGDEELPPPPPHPASTAADSRSERVHTRTTVFLITIPLNTDRTTTFTSFTLQQIVQRPRWSMSNRRQP